MPGGVLDISQIHRAVRNKHVAAVAKAAGIVLRDAALPQLRRLVGNQPGQLIEPGRRLLNAPGLEIFNRPGHHRTRVLGRTRHGEQSHDQVNGHWLGLYGYGKTATDYSQIRKLISGPNRCSIGA